MKNLLLITGAGASFDAVDRNLLPIAREELRPPLTRDLFKPPHWNLTESNYINECLKRHPVAAAFGLKHLSQKGGVTEEGLEAQLLKLKNHQKIAIKNHFWSIPLYLQELFAEISRAYIPTSNSNPLATNYKLLIEEIIESQAYGQLLWFNLNYDLLADCAIKSFVPRDFSNLTDYLKLETRDGFKIKYTKPHGSVDWYREVYCATHSPKLTEQLIRFYPSQLEKDFERRLSKHIVTKAGWQQVESEANESNERIFPYPAITVPLGEYDFVCQFHIDEMIPDLKTTTHILCIGFNAYDKDILELIKKHIKRIEKIKIITESLQTSQEVYRRLESYYGKIAIPQASYDKGFSHFIKEDLRKWLPL